MPVSPRPSNPRAAIADFLAFSRQRSREQVIGALLAVLVTIIIGILFFVDSKVNTSTPPAIIFVESYKPDRTDADIKRDQVKDQQAKTAARVERKRQFQKIEKTFGM